MAKISSAMVYFQGELMKAGTKAPQTVQKMSMLKVISLASLKLSGSFLAGKARRRQRQASMPM